MTGTKNFKLLFPIGSGWREALRFIYKNLKELSSQKLIILKLISDWKHKLYNTLFQISDESNYVKNICLYYVSQIEEGSEFWNLTIFKKSLMKQMKQ